MLPSLRAQQAQERRYAAVDSLVGRAGKGGVNFMEKLSKGLSGGLSSIQSYTKRAAERHEAREGRKKDLEGMMKVENKERFRRESELNKLESTEAHKGEQYVTSLQAVGGGDGYGFVARDPVLEEAKRQSDILAKIAANTAANDDAMQRIRTKAEEIS